MGAMNTIKLTVLIFLIISVVIVNFTVRDVLEKYDVKSKNITRYIMTITPSTTKSAGAVTYPTPVVLLTYMRSGSTFVGNILQSNNDVFYLFEPHRLIQFNIRANTTFKYFNGSTKRYDDFLDAAVDALDAWFSCRFRDLPISFFSDSFLGISEKMKTMTSCNFMLKNSKTGNNTFKYQCAREMESVCLKSKYIAVKAIRIPLDIMEPLIQKYPHARILHLIRDPRATLKSQLVYSNVHKKTLSTDAARFCNRVYKDYVTMEYMKKQHPQTIFMFFYEDLARYPNSKSKEIYDFLGMKYTDKIEQYIYKITSAEKSCKGALCTVSSNSSQNAEKWRSKADMWFVSTIDQACLPLYSKLELRSIPNITALRDPNFNISTSKDLFSLGDFRYA